MRFVGPFALFLLSLIPGNARADAGEIQGMLHDSSGKAIEHAVVMLNDAKGKLVSTEPTDEKGHFRFVDVAPGSYVLNAEKGSTAVGSGAVSVIDSEPISKDLSPQDAHTLNIVIGHATEKMRNSFSPETGTSAFNIDARTIAALPEGEDTPLNKVLLQAPGVAEDSAASGSLHIRGEHANVQYRLNGILLPDGISGFGDTIDSHIIGNATLLDGTLPAQYGFHTAGVIDITTKNGFQNEGTADFLGGSSGVFQPSLSYGGTAGSTEYFVAATHLSSNLGIETPDRSETAIHDHTEQNKQFGYASYLINDDQRLEIIAGNSISYFQIPNNPNQTTGGYRLNNVDTFRSADLNERQFESNQYATVAWQGSVANIEVQIAPYIRNSELHYRPDEVGDLLFNGVASDVKYNDLATGIQNDTSWRLNNAHTVRAGFTVQNDHLQNISDSHAFLTDAAGIPLLDGSGNNVLSGPLGYEQSKDGQLYGMYVQDQWKLSNNLTINYGTRFDDMEEYVSANQLSPRVGVVYQPTDTTTLHAGYARYFTPPPMELVSNRNLVAFDDTTNAPAVSENNEVKPERSHDFDVGLLQKIDSHWQIGIDGYYKLVHDLLDEGQFGQALILTPFNYERGYIYGSEFTANYSSDRFKTYFNFAFSRAMGEDIVSSQFNFSDPAELSYIQNHYVHLDHDQTYSASAGSTYTVWKGTDLGIDSVFGSGLRKGFANTEHLPAYVTFNGSIVQDLNIFPKDRTQVRFTVVNLLNSAYELRDGSGIGVGAPQWGQRIGFFVGLSQGFRILKL